MIAVGPLLRAVVPVALWLLGTAGRAADLRLVGCDLLGTDFTKACYAYSVREGFTLAVALDGSRPGLAELTAGRANVAILIVPSADRLRLAEFESQVVGWCRVVVVVPAAVPLDGISLDQLRAVFGADVPLAYNRWGDLGLGAEWAGIPIVAQAPAVGLGFAADYFRATVLGGRPFKSQVGRYATPAVLLRELAGHSRALALAAGLPRDATGLKILPVAVRTGAPAFAPTTANLQSADYPMQLPVVLVVRRESAAKAALLVKFILGDESAAWFEAAEIVPLPAVERRQRVQAMGEK